jgi:hypothetical protein
MKKLRSKNNQGMALVMALMLVAVALLTLATLFTRLIAEDNMVTQFQTYNSTFQGLEAAFAMGIIEVESVEDGIIGVDESWSPYYNGNDIVLPDFDDSEVSPRTLASMPDVSFFSYTVDWGTDGRDSNGDGTADSVTEQDMKSMYVMAKSGNVTRTAEGIFDLNDINVWNNAIFAGAGQAGGLINGNVSIHGSVHLLGNDIAAGGTALAALDLSGTSMIHNNYQGMPADLLARIPALPQELFDGETVDTLEAKLRVKNGLVGMSGNSEIGEVHSTGNDYKETMEATFVNDGWTGNAVTPDAEGRGDPKSVESDNGWDETYDLGDKVPLPLLSDDWRDPVDGSTVTNPGTGVNYTHEEYFTEVLLAAPALVADGIYTGDITLDPGADDFYYNATTGETIIGDASAAAPAATDDYILYRPATAPGSSEGKEGKEGKDPRSIIPGAGGNGGSGGRGGGGSASEGKEGNDPRSSEGKKGKDPRSSEGKEGNDPRSSEGKEGNDPRSSEGKEGNAPRRIRVLEVKGQIKVDGSLTFTGSGSDTVVPYSGRGAILATNVRIDTDLLACNDGDPTNTANSFPVNNILGLMASESMLVGTTSQLSIMGAFYAQEKITSSKQTNVIGTFVSNYFDMGKNVPSIFQVPALADNLPVGMIGNFPILSLTRLSWRELGV